MSYDLHLYRNKNDKPFKTGEVKEKLGKNFNRVEENVIENEVAEFTLHSNKNIEHMFHYQGEQKGYYWTSCTYSAGQEVFNDFLNTVYKVSKILNLKIKDPQINETELMNPQDFLEKQKSNQAFFNKITDINQNIVKFLPYMLRLEEKINIIFFAVSLNPKTSKECYLTLENGNPYSSIVNAGESIDDAVKQDIKNLTGSTEYEILNTVFYDKIIDKNNREINRYVVNLKIPYFNPEAVNAKYKTVWVTDNNSQ